MNKSKRSYYQLTKPGIIYGNALTVAGGFLLAAKGHVDIWLFISVILGSSLVIASGCVFNNYLDRTIDKQMQRTKKRALVIGTITTRSALTFGMILGIIGFAVLSLYTNLTTVFVGLVGIIFYVIIYGYVKRRSVYGTIVGSVSGAAPVVAGYTAVTGHLNLGALLLFIILATWQMPHFYAIAMYRAKEYKAAGVPVLPLVKGMQTTKLQISFYIVAFVTACALLTLFHYAGYSFLVIMVALGVAWLYRGFSGLKTLDDAQWGRKMFLFSLIVISGLSVMLSVGSILA